MFLCKHEYDERVQCTLHTQINVQYDCVSIILVDLLIFHSDNLYECEFISTLQEIKESENLVNVLFNFLRFKDIVMPAVDDDDDVAAVMVYPQ